MGLAQVTTTFPQSFEISAEVADVPTARRSGRRDDKVPRDWIRDAVVASSPGHVKLWKLLKNLKRRLLHFYTSQSMDDIELFFVRWHTIQCKFKRTQLFFNSISQ